MKRQKPSNNEQRGFRTKGDSDQRSQDGNGKEELSHRDVTCVSERAEKKTPKRRHFGNTKTGAVFRLTNRYITPIFHVLV
jgi:hypothetical protein